MDHLIDGTASPFSNGHWGVGLGVGLVTVIAWWKLFDKAGYAGVLAIIPVVNLATVSKIVFDNYWYTLLFFVPLVNIVYGMVLTYRLMKQFGCTDLIAVLAMFFPFFMLLPAFGENRYMGFPRE